jgi:glucose-6-phosphate isomerase
MLSLRFDAVMAARIGAEGLSESDLDEGLAAARQAYEACGRPGFAALPAQRETATRVREFAARARRRFKSVVHIGIGGSALGAIAVCSALSDRFHNERARPRLYFLDNVDPEETASLFSLVKPRETLFHVVTKSGETTETLAGFLVALDRAKHSIKGKWRDHFVVTTDRDRGFLRRWAADERIASFEIPADVGGRFSALSPVGLLPAALAGIEPQELLDGAEAAQADHTLAVALAAIPWLLDTRRGKRIHVMMPYSRALRDLADWFRQLWAESLGKSAKVGPTPVLALGATDQHSQVQLYTEGPNDKLFLLVRAMSVRADAAIPAALKDPSCDFLHGRRMSEVIDAELRGTEAALAAAGRPVVTLQFPSISAWAVGAFLQSFMWATAIAGRLYGVDPYTQPGVEAGKKAAFALLGRPGYEASRAEIEKSLTGDARHQVR